MTMESRERSRSISSEPESPSARTAKESIFPSARQSATRAAVAEAEARRASKPSKAPPPSGSKEGSPAGGDSSRNLRPEKARAARPSPARRRAASRRWLPRSPNAPWVDRDSESRHFHLALDRQA